MYQTMIGGIFISIIIIASWTLYFYNNIINKKTEVENSWRIIYLQLIYLQLKIRTDLMLKYVKTISSYDMQEKELLSQIMEAEHDFINATTTEEVMKSSLEISCGLERLLQNSGNHEECSIKKDFTQLQNQLKELNQKVKSYYKLYDDKVMSYNKYLSTFPSNITSRILGIKPMPCFLGETPDLHKKSYCRIEI
ncbi:LemA family protein [Natronincola peptidivorans]|uniref:LemA family protein n=1 Tax=Natronincola peptidivorans TaxID=426128 RepID=A0A1I0DR35_9FIRM|nr:LemA family protein [Natronincola peptidivorans]SET34205.1 LemA family protein [Natronincola peptidivorans]